MSGNGYGEDAEAAMGAWWRALMEYEKIAKDQGGGLTEEQHAAYEAIKARAKKLNGGSSR
jgi:hypothetical protein